RHDNRGRLVAAGCAGARRLGSRFLVILKSVSHKGPRQHKAPLLHKAFVSFVCTGLEAITPPAQRGSTGMTRSRPPATAAPLAVEAASPRISASRARRRFRSGTV